MLNLKLLAILLDLKEKLKEATHEIKNIDVIAAAARVFYNMHL